MKREEKKRKKAERGMEKGEERVLKRKKEGEEITLNVFLI